MNLYVGVVDGLLYTYVHVFCSTNIFPSFYLFIFINYCNVNAAALLVLNGVHNNIRSIILFRCLQCRCPSSIFMHLKKGKQFGITDRIHYRSELVEKGIQLKFRSKQRWTALICLLDLRYSVLVKLAECRRNLQTFLVQLSEHFILKL